jgi:hypothetical protein
MSGDLIPFAKAAQRVRPAGAVLPIISPCIVEPVGEDRMHLRIDRVLTRDELRRLGFNLMAMAESLNGGIG